MKFNNRTKKLLLILFIAVVTVTASGCTIPKNADGSIKLIETTTTFSETMGQENWFSAIFVWPLAQLINWMTPKIGVGLSIATITIVINAILALATMKSQVAQQEMQLIQPELEKIQRKYEGRNDDLSKQKQAQEMQRLYAEHNINPMGTMLVTFIQLPIIMAMYMAVERASAVANGTFFGMKLDVTPLNGMKAGQWTYIILFAVMGILQFISMRIPMYYSKKRAAALAAKQHRKPQNAQNSQGKIMQIYMMGMILVFGLMWPAAMTVYWAINSLVNIIKTVLVQKKIDSAAAKKEGSRR